MASLTQPVFRFVRILRHRVGKAAVVCCKRHITQVTLSTRPVAPITVQEAQDHTLGMVASGGPRFFGMKEEEVFQQENVVPIVHSQDELLPKKMSDSYREIIIPLGQDVRVREKYVGFWNGLRFGRILEDLDTLAVLISYTHMRDPSKGAKQKSPYANVTALVDRMDLHEHAYLLSPNKDVKLSGHVTWVGKSSMEITMILEQELDSRITQMLSARFLMVARNPVTEGAGVVNHLVPDGDIELGFMKLGENNSKLRREKSSKSLLKLAPTEEERQIIHNLFLQTLDKASGTYSIRIKPENTVWMETLKLKTVVVCHPEQRNIYGKMFGGFLMSKALELAWANAAMFCKSMPLLCIMDDTVFQHPVEVGSLLLFSSQILYTEGSLMVVKVHAQVQDVKMQSRMTTNHFHFTFDSTKPNLERVVPRTYAESMMFLDGMRHLKDQRGSWISELLGRN